LSRGIGSLTSSVSGGLVSGGLVSGGLVSGGLVSGGLVSGGLRGSLIGGGLRGSLIGGGLRSGLFSSSLLGGDTCKFGGCVGSGLVSRIFFGHGALSCQISDGQINRARRNRNSRRPPIN
jgi:hypothetical protein